MTASASLWGSSAHPTKAANAPALDLEARLLHRDGLMLILDKPAGVPVHRGPKGSRPGEINLEQFFDQLMYGLPRFPALAHRLDKDTSGCLVLGRHRKALEKLGLLFKQGKVGKTYWAVVEGSPASDAGAIDLPLGRLDENRGWWMKVDPAGQPSRTLWRVAGRGLDPSTQAPIAWLALEPITGRTHQLRVHCQAMGWPILGDPIYGTGPRDGGTPLHLHSREIVVPISKNKEPVVATAPVPGHMRERLLACGWNGVEAPPTSAPHHAAGEGSE
ncbi:RNA pseudouridine synthase [Alsobacter metallidurans]|uniref:RNA pseudouridine synthase n=1 Tax=Alsobacter metallidurans TaxID=340221 RepID=A0A917MJR9_9HYPH|nr:RNA pseudouridine synthase [Alsobacter metallidurans]GGH33049.1 RNA pseudouridine synthase [Alsobacter metallidurans]